MSKFKFKKKYGQNFLKNPLIIEKIIKSINPTKDDLIIEIGPGAGVITKELKKYECNILCFEIDKEVEKFLSPLKDQKTQIIYGDFLEIDVKKYVNEINYNKLYIIGNLPYYITTPIIEKIISLNLHEESLTIMVQKEVAERFMAQPKNKEYGYMTVLLNYNYKLEKVVDALAKDFYPIPKVNSTVIKLVAKDRENVDYELFKKLLKDAFQFKRKTLNNNLFNYNRDLINNILKQNGYSLSNRAEDIPYEIYIKIANNI